MCMAYFLKSKLEKDYSNIFKLEEKRGEKAGVELY